MEFAALEVELLARVTSSSGAISQCREVFDSLGYSVSEHTENNATLRFTINLDVEENFLGDSVEGLSRGDRQSKGDLHKGGN